MRIIKTLLILLAFSFAACSAIAPFDKAKSDQAHDQTSIDSSIDQSADIAIENDVFVDQNPPQDSSIDSGSVLVDGQQHDQSIEADTIAPTFTLEATQNQFDAEFTNTESHNLIWCFGDGNEIELNSGPISHSYGSNTKLPVTIRVYATNLTGITYFNLINQKLSGPFPSAFFKMPDLEQLILDGNQFSGTLPSPIDIPVNLKKLHLKGLGGSLTGPLPDFSALTQLKELHLYNQGFTGAIPKTIGDLINLEQLSLRNNKLISGIPNEIGKLTKLWLLHLDNNPLGGPIPGGEIGKLIDLKQFMAYANQLTGSFPKELYKLTKLEQLFLHTNQLEGKIPKEFKNLPNLEIVELQNNKFTEIEGDAFKGLDAIETINLSNNEIEDAGLNQLISNLYSNLQNYTALSKTLDISGNPGTLSDDSCLSLSDLQQAGWSITTDPNDC